VTGPELVLAATFVAIWLLPLALAIGWERRNCELRARVERARRDGPR